MEKVYRVGITRNILWMLVTSLCPRSTLNGFLCIYFHMKTKSKSVIIISIERKITDEVLSYCTCASVNTGVTSISIKNNKDVSITTSSGTVRWSSIFIYSIQNTKITKKLDTIPKRLSKKLSTSVGSAWPFINVGGIRLYASIVKATKRTESLRPSNLSTDRNPFNESR